MELRIIDISSLLAALVLPVWIIWRSPRYYISIPIGTLMFWVWIVVGGELILYLDPYYDSIAPGIFYYYGWLIGVVYCLFWAGIREGITYCRKSWNFSRARKGMP